MSRSVGAAAERRAAVFLEQLGFQILEVNYTCRQGEIDLVCREGDTLCFVEVRARRDARHGLPEETIGTTKRRRIARAAARYLVIRGLGEPACRFDVVTMLGDDPPALQRDAFNEG